jgi:histidinol-phosphatase (PHP family)
MLTSYHVHSRWSDGEGEISDFVRAAKELGLDEIGFSDHYVRAPDSRKLSWSMPPEKLGDYVEAVQIAAGLSGEHPIVRLGVEADFFPETTKALAEALAGQPFDYVIGAVHFVDGFPIDAGASYWAQITQAERNDVMRAYWVRIRQMAESGLFDFAAHLDLTKKFGFRPTIDLTDEISAALDAIAGADMAVEVNTAGWYAPCGEAYPEASILRRCSELGIPILVTADAHHPANLLRGYEDGRRLVLNLGYRHLASYAGRRPYAYPIEW